MNSEDKVSSGYDAWVQINSIRIHFTNVKDVGGLLYRQFPQEKYEKDASRFTCEKIAKDYLTVRNVGLYAAANFVHNPKIWFHDLKTDKCRMRYFEARRNLDAPVRSMQKLFDDYTLEQLKGGNSAPLYITELMAGRIIPEQICLLEIVSPFIEENAAKYQGNIVVDMMSRRIRKYRKFCTIPNIETKNAIVHTIKH